MVAGGQSRLPHQSADKRNRYFSLFVQKPFTDMYGLNEEVLIAKFYEHNAEFGAFRRKAASEHLIFYYGFTLCSSYIH